MNSVNLLPGARKCRLAARSRVRTWSIIGAVYGVGLLAAAPLLGPDVSSAAAETDRALAEARQRLETAEARLKELRPKLLEVQGDIDATRSVTEHPDWSILIDLVSRLRQDDAVLDAVEISGPRPMGAGSAAPPGSPAPKASAPARPGAPELFTLTLSGAARTPSAVAQLAIRLEQTGLFTRVQIAETAPTDSHGAPATAFRIRCEAQPPAATPEGPRSRAGGRST